jgi:hypothetical protein
MSEETEQQQQQPTIQPPDESLVRRAYNAIFGGRRKRRKAYRKFLKANKVPKPIFKTVGETLTFKRLNAATFVEDIMRMVKAQQQQAAEQARVTATEKAKEGSTSEQAPSNRD